jgi:hypothetical protein
MGSNELDCGSGIGGSKTSIPEAAGGLETGQILVFP